MKQNGYSILCEVLECEDIENKIPGQPDVLPMRPIDTLTKATIKDASKKNKEYTAKATNDPDPKKMKSNPVKGIPAGHVK